MALLQVVEPKVSVDFCICPITPLKVCLFAFAFFVKLVLSFRTERDRMHSVAILAQATSAKQANPMPEGAAPKAGASMPMAVAKAEAGAPVVGRLRPADTGDVAPPPRMHIPIRVIVDAKARSKASPKQANPMPEGAAPKAGASMPMAVAKKPA